MPLFPVLPVLCVADEGVGVSFPRTFKDTVRTIVRRLFRVYAHIYSSHFDQICALGIEGAFLLIYRGTFSLSVDVYKPTLIRAIATFSSSSMRYVTVRGANYALLTGRVVRSRGQERVGTAG